jgi:hypothetical protein
MLVGGVDAHRYDLSSMVMLKDNHIWSKGPSFLVSSFLGPSSPSPHLTGSITQAVQAAKSVAGFALRVHVECQSLAEAREAIAAGADIIMLDNFTPTELHTAAAQLKQDWVQSGGEESEKKAGAKRCLIEVSGGLTEENLGESLCPGGLCSRGVDSRCSLTPSSQTSTFSRPRRSTRESRLSTSASRFSPRPSRGAKHVIAVYWSSSHSAPCNQTPSNTNELALLTARRFVAVHRLESTPLGDPCPVAPLLTPRSLSRQSASSPSPTSDALHRLPGSRPAMSNRKGIGEQRSPFDALEML